MLRDRISGAWFRCVHRSNLIYNACWEDPRVDRVALELGPTDTVLVITSAGCNALDYVLDNPAHVFAVDVNPWQNALLELKIAGIRGLDYQTFFSLFGQGRLEEWRDVYGSCLLPDVLLAVRQGRLEEWRDVYGSCLRPLLSGRARRYWDRHGSFFSGSGWRDSLYFRGTVGMFARLVNHYIDHHAKLRDQVEHLLNANSVDEQRALYDEVFRNRFWRRWLRWVMARDATLSLLGVPLAQRRQIDADYPGGIVQFIEDRVETVFARLPLADNYFWRVYLTGQYTASCCPEYLKPEGFARLQEGLVDQVSAHTDSISGFLQRHPVTISRFVLLDHMDWLWARYQPMLTEEWQQICQRAAPGARILWRSAGLQTEFVDCVAIDVNGRSRRVGELLCYHRAWAQRLHAIDRVQTYGSFCIADLMSHAGGVKQTSWPGLRREDHATVEGFARSLPAGAGAGFWGDTRGPAGEFLPTTSA